MAKQNKRELYTAYVDEVLAAVPEDQRDSLRAAYLHESVIDRNADAFMRQSDYSRNMDQISKAEKALEERLASELEKVKGWEAYATDALTKASQLEEQVSKYRQTYGDLTNTPPSAVRKEDIEALMDNKLNGARQGLDEWVMKSVDALTDLKIEHRDRFKEKLDTRELAKFAKDHGYTTIESAYTAFVAPKVEEAREAEFKLKMEEAVKQAREEGRKAALADRFPGGGAGRTIAAEPPKDAIVRNDQDRVARATQTLETLMAGR